MRHNAHKPPRLLDQVREVARLRRFILSTEKSYVYYIQNFMLFHDKRHPKNMSFMAWAYG